MSLHPTHLRSWKNSWPEDRELLQTGPSGPMSQRRWSRGALDHSLNSGTNVHSSHHFLAPFVMYQKAFIIIVRYVRVGIFLTYHIAENICGGKSWRKCKIQHIGGFKFGGFTIIHQPHPSFKLPTRVRMEGEPDVTKFVLESRKAINFFEVTKKRHLHTILDKTRAWYVRQNFARYKFGVFFHTAKFTDISHYTVIVVQYWGMLITMCAFCHSSMHVNTKKLNQR